MCVFRYKVVFIRDTGRCILYSLSNIVALSYVSKVVVDNTGPKIKINASHHILVPP